MSVAIVTKRKKWRKKAQKRFPGYCMAWRGGQLCFTDDVPASAAGQFLFDSLPPVPGIPLVPEHGTRKVVSGDSRDDRANRFQASQQRTPRPSPLKSGLEVFYNYDDLPRARHEDGECRKCMSFPNPKKKVQTHRGEVRELITCSRCGLEMRPWTP